MVCKHTMMESMWSIYSMCMSRHLRYMTAFAVHFLLENKMKHHHLAYKCKNAYGALFYLPWLGTECRHATIMFFISILFSPYWIWIPFFRTNLFHCPVTLQSPILAQAESKLNCFSSSWTLSKNELTFPSSFPVLGEHCVRNFLLDT